MVQNKCSPGPVISSWNVVFTRYWRNLSWVCSLLSAHLLRSSSRRPTESRLSSCSSSLRRRRRSDARSPGCRMTRRRRRRRRKRTAEETADDGNPARNDSFHSSHSIFTQCSLVCLRNALLLSLYRLTQPKWRVRLSFRLYIRLPVCSPLFVHPSVCPSVCSFVCVSVCVCPPVLLGEYWTVSKQT